MVATSFTSQIVCSSQSSSATEDNLCLTQKDLFGTPPTEVKPSDLERIKRDAILEKIEKCFQFFTFSLTDYPRPTFFVPGQQGSVAVEFHGYHSLHKFACVSTLLNVIYKLLQTNTYQNKRLIYYEYKRLFCDMRCLDMALLHVRRLLCEIRPDLHILATSKGLLAGNLSFTMGDGTNVCCEKLSASVPLIVNDIVSFETDARFVLVVEKDTIFEQLLYENFCDVYGPCILVTAKGYPDLATRMFLQKFTEATNLPLIALMDGDPHGVEIYLSYKFGSPSKENTSNFQLNNMLWIGVFSSEISTLPLERTSNLEMNEKEKRKVQLMLERPLVQNDPFLANQLSQMRETGIKIELEAIASLGNNYLTCNYLRPKMRKLMKTLSQSASQ